MHLVRPLRSQFEELLVHAHGDVPRVGDDQRLARELVRAVVLIVLHDVAAQGINGLRSPEDAVHRRQIMFATINGRLIDAIRNVLVLLVQFAEHVLIQLERHHTALVEHRAGGAVLDRLRHVVHVHIIAEYLTRGLVLRLDRSAGESNVGGVRQRLPHLQRVTHRMRAVRMELYLQPVLAAMRLIGHDHDVAAFGQRFVGLTELLHRGEHDAVRLPIVQ